MFNMLIEYVNVNGICHGNKKMQITKKQMQKETKNAKEISKHHLSPPVTSYVLQDHQTNSCCI